MRDIRVGTKGGNMRTIAELSNQELTHLEDNVKRTLNGKWSLGFIEDPMATGRSLHDVLFRIEIERIARNLA